MQLDWDDSIGEEERKNWVSVFRDLFQAEKHPIPRCVKPQLYSGDPEFIFFSNASEQAYRACIYVRYAMLNGSFVSRLFDIKDKIGSDQKDINCTVGTLWSADICQNQITFGQGNEN